jgi:DNA mismatch repair protein MutL
MVFVNGRRIMEYSLLQAIEYGTEGHFPNGGHPFACLYVTIDPALVDFNIHPAKKEARFRDGATLHHAVSSTIRDFFRRYTIANLSRDAAAQENGGTGFLNGIDDAIARSTVRGQTAQREYSTPRGYDAARYDSPRADRSSGEVAYREERYSPSAPRENFFRPREYDTTQEQPIGGIKKNRNDFRYLGQVLGTFLAVERNGLFYLVDQHAAHERILFDRLMSERGNRQELLVPYRIETTGNAENARLAEMSIELAEAGFILKDEGEGIWQVTAVPSRWTGTQQDLTDELSEGGADANALVSHLYATSACRAACKDGDALDDGTATDLIAKAFELDEPVCPHGRPIWIIMDRDDLFRRIRRT